MIPHASTAQEFESLWKLRGITFSQLGRNVLSDIVAINVFGQAARSAFYFLFAMAPLILITVELFGLFAPQKIELQNDFLSCLANFLPPAAFQLLQTVGRELAVHYSGGKLTLGIATALWGVSGGITGMISSLNLAYRVRETRSWFTVRAIALALTLLISMLLLVALFMVLVGNSLVGRVGTALGLHPIVVLVWKGIQWPAALLFIFAACELIYHFGPNLRERRRWQWLTPGSIFGVLVWVATSFGLRMYLHFFGSYSAAYGLLGAVMILMLWLYMGGLAYLIGVEINAEITRAGQNHTKCQWRNKDAKST